MNPAIGDWGVGVGLRPPHHQNFLHEKPKSVRWVEVISENFMPWRGQDFGAGIQTLDQVREDYPVALHGVSMNLGSCDSLDMDYMNRLKMLIQRINPLVVSDHLSWTGVDGYNTHDLLPMPYTQDALRLLAEKIDQAQNFLGRSLLIENPSSYLEFSQSEIPEWEFINQLLQQTGCGLLLDINNVYVSSVNHGFDPHTYISSLPPSQIQQIHLAGHSQMDGYLIDTHDAPVCEEVWSLYAWVLDLIGPKNVMIERDGHIPTWLELEMELNRVREIHEHVRRSS